MASVADDVNLNGVSVVLVGGVAAQHGGETFAPGLQLVEHLGETEQILQVAATVRRSSVG